MIIQEQRWKVIMIKEHYSLQILRKAFIKNTNNRHKLLFRYNLNSINEDKSIFQTDNKSRIKIQLDLLGLKPIKKSYQRTSIAGYIFYE